MTDFKELFYHFYDTLEINEKCSTLLILHPVILL